MQDDLLKRHARRVFAVVGDADSQLMDSVRTEIISPVRYNNDNAKGNLNQDFYAWTSQNAALLKARRFDEVDIDHVVEELESMGKSERRELINRLAILLAHLLKW